MKFDTIQLITYKTAKIIILIVHSLNLVYEFVYMQVQIVLRNVQVPIFFNILSDSESKYSANYTSMVMKKQTCLGSNRTY